MTPPRNLPYKLEDTLPSLSLSGHWYGDVQVHVYITWCGHPLSLGFGASMLSLALNPHFSFVVILAIQHLNHTMSAESSDYHAWCQLFQWCHATSVSYIIPNQNIRACLLFLSFFSEDSIHVYSDMFFLVVSKNEISKLMIQAKWHVVMLMLEPISYIYTYSYQENDQAINLCDIHTFFSEQKPSTLLMVNVHDFKINARVFT